jgi:uncharacterized protein
VKDLLRYDHMVELAMRGVVREALALTATKGLPGAHHFYITFKTRAHGVDLPAKLVERYPDEMTIVIEHQFWDLDVRDRDFTVSLSFNGKPERLTIPFGAVTAFADPSVKFGLQFPASDAADVVETPPPPVKKLSPNAEIVEPHAAPKHVAKPAAKPAEVVTLDAFRKK